MSSANSRSLRSVHCCIFRYFPPFISSTKLQRKLATVVHYSLLWSLFRTACSRFPPPSVSSRGAVSGDKQSRCVMLSVGAFPHVLCAVEPVSREGYLPASHGSQSVYQRRLQRAEAFRNRLSQFAVSCFYPVVRNIERFILCQWHRREAKL